MRFCRISQRSFECKNILFALLTLFRIMSIILTLTTSFLNSIPVVLSVFVAHLKNGPSTHERLPSGVAQLPQMPTPHLVT